IFTGIGNVLQFLVRYISRGMYAADMESSLGTGPNTSEPCIQNLKLIEIFVELFFSRRRFKVFELPFSRLREVCIGVSLRLQLLELAQETLVARNLLTLLFNLTNCIFGLLPGSIHFLDKRSVRNRRLALKDRL